MSSSIEKWGTLELSINAQVTGNPFAESPPDFWNFDYFQYLEKRIHELRELGIEADLIIFHPYDFGAWGRPSAA